jgi:hypothetical protein
MNAPSRDDNDKILRQFNGHQLAELERELRVLRHRLYVRLVAAMILCIVLSLATAHWIWNLHP